jgi:hypothetical protein
MDLSGAAGTRRTGYFGVQRESSRESGLVSHLLTLGSGRVVPEFGIGPRSAPGVARVLRRCARLRGDGAGSPR